MDEYVATALPLNETVALGVVEPLDLTCNAHRSLPYRRKLHMSFRAQKKTASACAASTATLWERPSTQRYPKHLSHGCQGYAAGKVDFST
jgi:hypothetical protein